MKKEDKMKAGKGSAYVIGGSKSKDKSSGKKTGQALSKLLAKRKSKKAKKGADKAKKDIGGMGMKTKSKNSGYTINFKDLKR